MALVLIDKCPQDSTGLDGLHESGMGLDGLDQSGVGLDGLDQGVGLDGLVLNWLRAQGVCVSFS